MVPHQIYQALTDQRSHELQAVARRHERVSDTRVAATDRVEGSSRLRGALGHLAALVHVRRSAYAARTTTGSAAAPMGCVA